jgi:hypothetical protein
MALLAVLALGGCAKPDREVCAARGFAASSPEFGDCMSTLMEKHRAVAALQDRQQDQVRAQADMAGRWGSGCAQNMAKIDCNFGD